MALIKRIKNVSGATKQILNRDIAHNSYYEVPETMWQELANDQGIKSDISAGNLIVNNGTADLTIDDALRLVVQFQDVEAYEVSFDTAGNSFESDNVQDALVEIKDGLENRPGAQVVCGFDGGASNGRWLEFTGNVESNVAGFVVPRSSTITHLSVSAVSNATCTFTVYKNRSSVGTISLSASRKNSNTQNIALAQNDELSVKVTSGSASKPMVAIFIRIN